MHPETEILLTSDAPQKLLDNGSSRQRTIGIVYCFLAPGELIITGQGSNLFVFGSDSKRLSAGFHISSDHTACRTSLLPTIISPHSLSTEGWGLSHERCGGATGMVFFGWCYVWMQGGPKIKLFGNTCPQSHPTESGGDPEDLRDGISLPAHPWLTLIRPQWEIPLCILQRTWSSMAQTNLKPQKYAGWSAGHI